MPQNIRLDVFYLLVPLFVSFSYYLMVMYYIKSSAPKFDAIVDLGLDYLLKPRELEDIFSL